MSVDLQALVTAAAPDGVVDIPAGVYELASTLHVPPDVTVRGAGLHRTILRATASMHSVISMAAESVMIHRGSVSDLTCDAAGHASYGLRGMHLGRVTWERVRAAQGVYASLMLEGCVHMRLSRVEGVSSVSGLRMNVSPTGEPTRFIHVDGGVLQSNTYGFVVEHAAGVYLRGLEIDNNNHAGYAGELCVTAEGVAIVIDGCWCERNNGPITLTSPHHAAALHVIRDTLIVSGANRPHGVAVYGGAIPLRYHIENVSAQNALVTDYAEYGPCVRTTAGHVLGSSNW
jgi:hypothetical protein